MNFKFLNGYFQGTLGMKNPHLDFDTSVFSAKFAQPKWWRKTYICDIEPSRKFCECI